MTYMSYIPYSQFSLTSSFSEDRLSVRCTLSLCLITSEGRMKANLDNAGNSGLATDLYQLTMAAAYHANGRDERASFELFTRKLPEGRSYLIVAGLGQALDYLRGLSFSAGEIEYLRGLPTFVHVSAEFFDYLRDFRFTGDVW